MPHLPRKLKFCVFSVFWMITNIILLVWVLNKSLENETKTTSKFILTFMTATYICILVSNTWGSLKHPQNVEKLLQNILEVDSLLGKKWCKSFSFTIFYFRLFCYHLIFLIILLIKFMKKDIMNDEIWSKYKIFFFICLTFQKIIIMVTIDTIKNILISRYQESEKLIADKMSLFKVCHRRILDQELKKWKKIHFLLHDGVEKINVIFGLPILVLILNTTGILLRIFNEIMFANAWNVQLTFWEILEHGMLSTVSICII